ncbi:MAG: outer membrane beta-barrel protein, partial [Acidobacteriota bacterium]
MDRLFSAAVMVALLCASQLSAQSPQRRPAKQKYEVSFFVGWSSLGDRSFVTAADDGSVNAVGVDFESGPAFAFRVTDNFSQHLGAELEYAFSGHDSAFTNLAPMVPLLDVKQRLHTFSYSAVIYPTDRRGRIRPFAILGAGATYFQTSTDLDELALSNGIDLKNRWKFA